MRKKVILVLLAGCLCCSTAAMVSYAETPAHALTIIASVTNLSVSKNTIAVGESVQLELEWSTGAKQSVFYSSSDENVAIVDQNGLITGVGNGTATITVSHSNIGTDKTITIDVSDDVETSKTYQTSELTLGTKLKKYDTLHYTGDGAGSCLNVVNTKGDYDLVYLNSGDYVLPFDAEIVGIDGLVMYVAPDIEGVTYLDGRTLSVGDTIDRNTHLLCYDYHINDLVLPVFLPQYYSKYIGDGTIRVKAIDHDEKTITLESVDEFDWLPATMDDYEAFIAKNGNVFVHGNYIVYCDTINYSTGDEVILEQLGTAEIKEVKEYNISSDEPIPPGSQSHAVYVYEAVSAGTVKVTISQGRPWDPEQTKNVRDVGYYKIGEDMSVEEIDESEFSEPVKGDVNADGKLNAADAVMLQKWLTGVPDATLSNWKAADLYEDGVLNAFDLCMMKRELMNQNQYDDTPVLFINDYRIIMSENGWDGEDYEQIITANGNRYSAPLCNCVYLSVDDHMNHIKEDGEKESYITDAEVLQKISEFTKNAAKYKDCEMKAWGFGITDYGEQTLYVLYHDEDGTTQQLELCRFGGDCAWLDNAEVQEFVTMLIQKGYFAEKDMFEAYLKNLK